jgi:Na+-transporting NADH:ubiquinone oxidoreductase subunit NqrE
MGKALNSSEALSCLSVDLQATVYTLNAHLALICFVFAYLSLFQRKEMLTTRIGQAVTAAIGLFWILRAVNQVVFYGVSAPDTPFWVIVCLVVSSFYLIPIAWKRPTAPAPMPS